MSAFFTGWCAMGALWCVMGILWRLDTEDYGLLLWGFVGSALMNAICWYQESRRGR